MSSILSADQLLHSRLTSTTAGSGTTALNEGLGDQTKASGKRVQTSYAKPATSGSPQRFATRFNVIVKPWKEEGVRRLLPASSGRTR